jgi:hypothetical protein
VGNGGAPDRGGWAVRVVVAGSAQTLGGARQ